MEGREGSEGIEMTIRFYSYWTRITNVADSKDADADLNKTGKTIQFDRMHNNKTCQELANELNTVLGTQKLISMTSSATNGIIVTTIAYEETEGHEFLREQEEEKVEEAEE